MASSDKGVLERCLTVYTKSVDKLRENLKTLYSNYYHLCSEKYECEGGDRLSVNSQNFNKSLIDALNRCDEIEIQLLNFESWIDLPIVNTTDTSTNFDEVSDDAQHLVDIVQQVQSALLSSVSDSALKDALPERRSMEVFKSSQRVQQPPPRLQIMPQPQYQHQPEMAEFGSIPTPLFSDDQSGIPINDGPVPLGALNPTIPPPQQAYTPPRPQSRRIYSDVPSPFSQAQHHTLNMSRTGSDPNLIYHQQFMQQQQQQQLQPQQQQDVMHMQGLSLPPQNPNNPGSYGYQ
ncbi:unnamed protein product [Hymenolepis diminuta]|uniref:Uncharacterized protein n=1 Tax=Hymenolepis diminuta TaxID=6216 RepID=A0A564YEH4_HYMDI|nr:unnamed protein product [Hymenolepis diminuta]